MAIYSHSKIGVFEQCRLRYKYKYIDKKKPDREISIETILGKAVHDTLEWIYVSVKKKIIPIIDEIIIFYTDSWKNNYKEGTLIVKKEFTKEHYFNLGVGFLVDYFNSHHPFRDGTIECEKEIRMSLDEDGEYKIRGFIDRLVYNFETNEYEVHDYKTSNNLPTKERVETDRQLALYAIAIKKIFGEDKEVRLIWHYLAHNKKIDSTRTNEQLEQLKKETIEKIKEIESTKVFPYNKSPLCNWCEYKPSCPAWNKNIKHYSQKQLDI